MAKSQPDPKGLVTGEQRIGTIWELDEKIGVVLVGSEIGFGLMTLRQNQLATRRFASCFPCWSCSFLPCPESTDMFRVTETTGHPSWSNFFLGNDRMFFCIAVQLIVCVTCL